MIVLVTGVPQQQQTLPPHVSIDKCICLCVSEHLILCVSLLITVMFILTEVF